MEAFKANPAKAVSIVGAILALAATYIPGIPTEAILAVVAAILGGGVAAQKVEDKKTAEAYEAVPEDIAGVRRQNELLEALLEATQDQPLPVEDADRTAVLSPALAAEINHKTETGPVTWGK
ncbi:MULTISPECIES: hypothetical protein [Streptomyces]